ncbi:MAG TPA: hypothetical protein VGE07_19980 [Herpetosiphonaceae bacterium]
MSFSYQYEAVKEAARQQEREFERNTYQPEAAEPAPPARAREGGWRERIMRIFAPVRRDEASPECGHQPR